MISRILLLIAGVVLLGCSNPLGSSSTQSKGYHPGFGQSPPQLTSVLPVMGSLQGGTLLTLSGTGFQQNVKASIDGTDCLNIVFISSTRLTCVTPAHVASMVNITTTNPDTQSSTLANAFQYFSTSKPVAGFGQANGGGVASGPGVRMRFTAGGFGNPAQQLGTGVKVNTGLQGTMPRQ